MDNALTDISKEHGKTINDQMAPADLAATQAILKAMAGSSEYKLGLAKITGGSKSLSPPKITEWKPDPSDPSDTLDKHINARGTQLKK